MHLKIRVDGEPVAKARPRHRIVKLNTGNEFVHSYQPKKSSSYEGIIRHEALIEMRKYGIWQPTESPVSLSVMAYFGPPKGWPKYRRVEMANGVVMPVVKKPDIDNVVKACLDALNTVVYRDDALVYLITGQKLYSDAPRLEIEICTFGSTDETQTKLEV